MRNAIISTMLLTPFNCSSPRPSQPEAKVEAKVEAKAAATVKFNKLRNCPFYNTGLGLEINAVISETLQDINL